MNTVIERGKTPPQESREQKPWTPIEAPELGAKNKRERQKLFYAILQTLREPQGKEKVLRHITASTNDFTDVEKIKRWEAVGFKVKQIITEEIARREEEDEANIEAIEAEMQAQMAEARKRREEEKRIKEAEAKAAREAAEHEKEQEMWRKLKESEDRHKAEQEAATQKQGKGQTEEESFTPMFEGVHVEDVEDITTTINRSVEEQKKEQEEKTRAQNKENRQANIASIRGQIEANKKRREETLAAERKRQKEKRIKQEEMLDRQHEERRELKIPNIRELRKKQKRGEALSPRELEAIESNERIAKLKKALEANQVDVALIEGDYRYKKRASYITKKHFENLQKTNPETFNNILLNLFENKKAKEIELLHSLGFEMGEYIAYDNESQTVTTVQDNGKMISVQVGDEITYTTKKGLTQNVRVLDIFYYPDQKDSINIQIENPKNKKRKIAINQKALLDPERVKVLPPKDFSDFTTEELFAGAEDTSDAGTEPLINEFGISQTETEEAKAPLELAAELEGFSDETIAREGLQRKYQELLQENKNASEEQKHDILAEFLRTENLYDATPKELLGDTIEEAPPFLESTEHLHPLTEEERQETKLLYTSFIESVDPLEPFFFEGEDHQAIIAEILKELAEKDYTKVEAFLAATKEAGHTDQVEFYDSLNLEQYKPVNIHRTLEFPAQKIEGLLEPKAKIEEEITPLAERSLETPEEFLKFNIEFGVILQDSDFETEEKRELLKNIFLELEKSSPAILKEFIARTYEYGKDEHIEIFKSFGIDESLFDFEEKKGEDLSEAILSIPPKPEPLFDEGEITEVDENEDKISYEYLKDIFNTKNTQAINEFLLERFTDEETQEVKEQAFAQIIAELGVNDLDILIQESLAAIDDETGLTQELLFMKWEEYIPDEYLEVTQEKVVTDTLPKAESQEEKNPLLAEIYDMFKTGNAEEFLLLIPDLQKIEEDRLTEKEEEIIQAIADTIDELENKVQDDVIFQMIKKTMETTKNKKKRKEIIEIWSLLAPEEETIYTDSTKPGAIDPETTDILNELRNRNDENADAPQVDTADPLPEGVSIIDEDNTIEIDLNDEDVFEVNDIPPPQEITSTEIPAPIPEAKEQKRFIEAREYVGEAKKMKIFTTNGEENSSEYKDNQERMFEARLIAMGDAHSSTLKALESFIASGFIHFENPQTAKKFKDLYEKAVAAKNIPELNHYVEELIKLLDDLKELQIENREFIFTGDTLVDRGLSDKLMIAFVNKMKELDINVTVLGSNHDLDPLLRFIAKSKAKSQKKSTLRSPATEEAYREYILNTELFHFDSKSNTIMSHAFISKKLIELLKGLLKFNKNIEEHTEEFVTEANRWYKNQLEALFNWKKYFEDNNFSEDEARAMILKNFSPIVYLVWGEAMFDSPDNADRIFNDNPFTHLLYVSGHGDELNASVHPNNITINDNYRKTEKPKGKNLDNTQIEQRFFLAS